MKITIIIESSCNCQKAISVAPRVRPILKVKTPRILDVDISSNKTKISDVDILSKEEDILFQKLSELRKEIAYENNLPPYIIFHDKTLKDMATKLPTDSEGMLAISGIGATKLEKYGYRFLEVIKNHVTLQGGTSLE